MPTDVFVEPGWENAVVGDVYEEGATRVFGYGRSGNYSLRLPKQPASLAGGRWYRPMTWAVGARYSLLLHTSDIQALGVKLSVLVDDGSGTPFTLADVAPVGEWAVWALPAFTAQGSSGSLTLECDSSVNNRVWYVDDASLFEQLAGEVDMAVMLAELPLRAMLGTMQTYLNTELGYVKNEANDSLDLPAVTHWYCWDRGGPSPDETECEVFIAPGSLTFPYFESNMAAWTTGQRTSMAHSVSVTVRINHANRDLLKMSELQVRGWRYAAGIFRVVRNVPQLGQAAIMAMPGSPMVYIRDADPLRPAGQVVTAELTFACDVHEAATGETQVGGGTRPSATLES